MMKRTFYIFCSLIIVIALSISVSYSWILESTYKDPAYSLWIWYQDKLNSSSNKLDIIDITDIGFEVRKYLVNSTATVPVSQNEPLAMSEMVPGDSFNFVLRITNIGKAVNIKLFMSDIICSGAIANSEDLLDSLYLEVRGGHGYGGIQQYDYKTPDYLFYSLADLLSQDEDRKTAALYSTLAIPHMDIGQYVELECRFWLDSNAQNLDSISLSIGHFVLSL